MGRVVLLVSAVAVVLLGSAAVAHFAARPVRRLRRGALVGGAARARPLQPARRRRRGRTGDRPLPGGRSASSCSSACSSPSSPRSSPTRWSGSASRTGRSRCRDHLLVVGGVDLASVAASAASEAQLETELKRLVVLAPESARDSRAQILDDLEEAARRRPQDRPRLRRHRRRLGLRAGRGRAGAGDPADALDQRAGRRRGGGRRGDPERPRPARLPEGAGGEPDWCGCSSAAAATSTPAGSSSRPSGTRWSATAPSPPCCGWRSRGRRRWRSCRAGSPSTARSSPSPGSSTPPGRPRRRRRRARCG